MTAYPALGDALRLPLRAGTVDLIVTSPPYFGLRTYDGAHPAMVGAEPDRAAYLAALWAATREMARVLKPEGSIFVNLGDKYGGGGMGGGPTQLQSPAHGSPRRSDGARASGAAPPGTPDAAARAVPHRLRRPARAHPPGRDRVGEGERAA